MMRVWMGVWLQHGGPAIGAQCAAMGSVISGAAGQTSLGHMSIGELEVVRKVHSHRTLSVGCHPFWPAAKCLLSSAGRACAS